MNSQNSLITGQHITEPVSFGLPEWELPGVLEYQHHKEKIPAVLLVHGSGPQDRDETIGPNKVFKNLADGLVAQGIAVLRYDKRTLTHGKKLRSGNYRITLEEETVIDACAGVEYLRQHKAIDPNKIVVIGHSLGAMSTPLIASRLANLAGIVMMAAPARSYTAVLLDQLTYLISHADLPEEEKKAKIAGLTVQCERADAADLSPDEPRANLPLSTPGWYLLYLRNYNQVETAKSLRLPVLVLQGERDYQVTMKDYAIWSQVLSGVPNATLKSYPDLNHCFIAGEGLCLPAEYTIEAAVCPAVITDIGQWILRQPAASGTE